MTARPDRAATAFTTFVRSFPSNSSRQRPARRWRRGTSVGGLPRFCGAAALAACLAQPADAACRQALALGLDVSGSVDAREYRLQVDGLAAALMDEEVSAALLSTPDTPVRIAAYEWSGQGQIRMLVPWTEITGEGARDAVAARLRAILRVPGDPATALGPAMAFGAELLRQQADCWRLTLDVSGDGRANAGPRPRDVRADGSLAGITVNALVIALDNDNPRDNQDVGIAELTAYFRAEVIQGPDSFIETALGFDDYARAMKRKLLRELQVLVLGEAGGPAPRAGALPPQ